MGQRDGIKIEALIQTQRALLEENGLLRIVGSRCIATMLRERLSLRRDREIADLLCSVRRHLSTFSPERIIADEAARRLDRSEGGPMAMDELDWVGFRSLQPSSATPD